MSVRSGQSITKLFTTRRFDTGAATNADSTPAGTLYVNGTADAASVTVTNITTGVYKAAVTLPTLALNDIVDLRIAATVNSIADNGIIWTDTKDFFAGSIPDVAAGGTNGLFIAGTNAATVITTSLTTHFVGTVDTVTTYTGNTPQTGDCFARLGAPAGASVSADVAAVKSDTGTILTDVNTGAGAIYVRIGAPAGASIAADIAAVNAKTTNLPASPASTSNITAATVTLLDTAAITTASFAAGAINAAAIATDAIGSAEIAATAVTKIQSGLAMAASLPTNFASLAITVGGIVSANTVQIDGQTASAASTVVFPAYVARGFPKNVALANFGFNMLNNGVLTSGLTVAAQRSIDGGAFAPCTNSVVEISDGAYSINFDAADRNGNIIIYQFTAAGANDLPIVLVSSF